MGKFALLKKENGFSLIELIFVIAILSILISIVYPRIFEITNEAKRTGLQSTAISLKKSVELFISETNKMPKKNDNTLDFQNSTVEFVLTNNYEIEGLNSFNKENMSYTIKLYELNNINNRTGNYAIITEREIFLTN